MPGSRFSTWTFVLILLASLALVAHLLFGFLTPVVMALVIVSICSPVHKKILSLCRNRQFLAAGIATLLVFLCILIPLSFFLLSLIQQSLGVFEAASKIKSSGNFSGIISQVSEWLEKLKSSLLTFGIEISPAKILQYLTTLSQAVGKKAYTSLSLLAANIISLTFNFILMVVLVYIFFVSGRTLKQFLMDLFPLPEDEKERLVERFRELSAAVFLGNGLISVLEGTIGGILFWYFGISGALIWGVVMTVFAFLPVIGASIVVIPATIYLLITDSLINTILFATFNALQLGVLETFLKPRVIGNKSQMHAVLVFLAIIAGVQIYGIFGLFYGPLLVTMFLSLAGIYKEHYRDKLLKS